MKKVNRQKGGCPECGGDLELEGEGHEREWHCTGLVDPDNNSAEVQPCDFTRPYGSAKRSVTPPPTHPSGLAAG